MKQPLVHTLFQIFVVCVAVFCLLVCTNTVSAQVAAESADKTLASGPNTVSERDASEIASECLNFQRYILQAVATLPQDLGPTELDPKDERWPDAPGKPSLDPDSLFANKWLPGVMLKPGQGNGIATRPMLCDEHDDYQLTRDENGWLMNCERHGATPECAARLEKKQADESEAETKKCENFRRLAREALERNPAPTQEITHQLLWKGTPGAKLLPKDFNWDAHPSSCEISAYHKEKGWDVRCNAHGFLQPVKNPEIETYSPPPPRGKLDFDWQEWLIIVPVAIVVLYWRELLVAIAVIIGLIIAGVIFLGWYWRDKGKPTPPPQ
ncbi:MAG TPA: hypothetical protein PKO06_06205 [Candidatus Ozemobacteraceae bacterium]|nr:hypothetical protein [Candidatus Ozemobacteraceae bacterium]